MSTKGFTLVELLIVLAILSMMAGVVLPSAAVMTRRNQLESLIHNTAVLCREAFSAAVFSGKQYRIDLVPPKKLVVSYFENSRWQPVSDYWLRPLIIPDTCNISWPKNGLLILPEAYCESPKVRFQNLNSLETIFVNIRAYDAGFNRLQQ